jgi:hypothetical protein
LPASDPLVGIDLRLLHFELRIDVFDAGLRSRDLRVRLIESDAIVAVVDPGDHVVGGNMLVVGDGDGGDVTGHFRSERGLPRGDEGIVGGLKTAGIVNVQIAAAQESGEQHRSDRGDNGTPMQEAIPGLLGWLRPPFFRFRRCAPLGNRTFLRRRLARGDLLRPWLMVALTVNDPNRIRALKLVERPPSSSTLSSNMICSCRKL